MYKYTKNIRRIKKYSITSSYLQEYNVRNFFLISDYYNELNIIPKCYNTYYEL